MTDDEKCTAITLYLTGMIDGGYPGDCVWIGDTMAYTTSRGGGCSDLKYDSELHTIIKAEMLEWFGRAAAYCEWTEGDADKWWKELNSENSFELLSDQFTDALSETDI
jgi:hypothetical protein